MIGHHLTVAVRSLRRHGVATLINVLGLAAGMAVSLLILLWVHQETSYDRFHRRIDRLHLVGSSMQYGQRHGFSDGAPPALAPALAAECPEVARAARWHRGDRWTIQSVERISKEQIRLVDPAFLAMFSFGLVQGDATTALVDPFSIVLTERTARKHFGQDPAVGRLLRCTCNLDLRVTGVVADPPVNSSLTFDALVPLALLRHIQSAPEYLDTWHNCEFLSFIEVHAGADVKALEARIAGRVQAADPTSNITPFLFPFADYHLHSMHGPGGRIETVRVIALVGLLVLLIACVNFVNLATARGVERAREVGVRKALGAGRGQLMAQFYTESFLQAGAALALALVIAGGLLPALREITGAAIAGARLAGPVALAGAPLLALAAAIVAGSYPALVLSSFPPASVLRGAPAPRGRAAWLRRGLVVLQFAATAALLVGTTVVGQQHRFMRDRDRGFESENLIEVPLEEEIDLHFEAFESDLAAHPAVLRVSRATHSPVGMYWNGSGWDWEGRDPAVDPFVTYVAVDRDYLAAMGMALAEGSFFTSAPTGGHASEVVINESFARLIGRDRAVGARLYTGAGEDPAERQVVTVLGVVKDFNFRPVTDPIGPLVMIYDQLVPDILPWSAFVRVRPGEMSAALAHAEEVYHRHAPGRLFEPRIVAEQCARQHGDVEAAGKVLGAFALVALGISCLGLFGLASFMTGQRRREIGIRKALGAPAIRVAAMLGSDFARWVAVADLIALPVAGILASRWLEGFAYRIDLGPWPFLLAAGATFFVAVLTVGAQALRAASADPVRALRCE